MKSEAKKKLFAVLRVGIMIVVAVTAAAAAMI